MTQSELQIAGLRRPRDSFTRTLKKICSQLDDEPSAVIEWKEPMLRRVLSSRFALRSLWVVGSYARGALHCGDLDLVAEVVVEQGHMPTSSQVSKNLFNCPRDVRLYEGTPSNNVSGLEFSEAILIWRGDEYDWHKAIGDIQVNPNAVRFPRPLDRIPLRQEQLYCPIEHLEYILELERKQLIRWTFTPFQEIAPVEPISEDEQELTRIMNGSAGKNTLKLLPQIISYCRETMRWPLPYLAEPFDRSCYKFGGARISIGRPEVYVEDLDDISISRIIIVPHQSARGPNGVWMIERSERHPLILSVEGIKVFCLVDEEGKPIVSCRVGEFDHFNTPSWTQAKEMDIFTSRKSATNWARQFSKDFEEDIKVKVLESRELLTCLSHLDAVYIDDVEYAITSYGCIDAASAGISTAQEILGALTKVK